MKKLMPWLAISAAVTVGYLTVAACLQQIQRLDANDPQIQLAQDAATALNRGATPDSLLTGAKVDMAHSLAPYLIIYDRSGHMVGGTGLLEGTVPTVPIGVLQSTKNKPYNAITWEPETGVRVASVSVTANDFYVLSGRSLSEVEKRETKTQQFIVIGWLVAMVVITAGFLLKAKQQPAVKRR